MGLSWRAMTTGALALSVLPAAGAYSQPTGAPDFKPGADFAGVAGSAAENTRLTALCGPYRNAADGYAPAPARPDQTRAPAPKSKADVKVEVLGSLDHSVGMAFLPGGDLLVSQRSG